MPFGGYPDFAACVADKMKDGYKKEEAGGICGEIEKRHKQKQESKVNDYFDSTEYKEKVILM